MVFLLGAAVLVLGIREDCEHDSEYELPNTLTDWVMSDGKRGPKMGRNMCPRLSQADSLDGKK